ncbi:MAG: CHASE2 domain-containing protein, partial [Candidatus Omnitrophica bacterium]|nr:CHASE2 domain-containing protein [Candidatus Omnitrophota bacterium]
MVKDIFKIFNRNIILIALAVGIITCVFSGLGFLNRFELTTLDYRFKLRHEKKGLPQVAIIEIAEDSIQQVGRWPWPREWHAELINILKEHGVKVIDIDILFSESSTASADNLFARAIKNAGNVYLPFVFEQSKEGEIMVEPLPLLAQDIKGTGYINVLPDEDGVIRRVELIKEFNGKRYYHIGFKVVCDYLGVKEKDIHLYPKKFIELKNTKIGDIRIPIDETNRMILNWPGKWDRSFKHFSFVDIIVSSQQMKEAKEPRIDLAEFKDKICTIGLTATGLTDIKPIPLQTLYPALGVHGCIIDNVFLKDFIRDTGRPYTNTANILFAIIVAAIFLGVRKPARFVFFVFILAAAYFLLAILAFSFAGLWINIVYPLLSIALSYISVTLYSQIVSGMERARLYRLATVDSLTGLFVI